MLGNKSHERHSTILSYLKTISDTVLSGNLRLGEMAEQQRQQHADVTACMKELRDRMALLEGQYATTRGLLEDTIRERRKRQAAQKKEKPAEEPSSL